MTLARSTAGISKAEDAGTTHVDQVHRCFTADLADEADQLTRTSWMDAPRDLVRPEFSNISFEATRPKGYPTKIVTSNKTLPKIPEAAT